MLTVYPIRNDQEARYTSCAFKIVDTVAFTIATGKWMHRPLSTSEVSPHYSAMCSSTDTIFFAETTFIGSLILAIELL